MYVQERKQRVKIKELREELKERNRQPEYPPSNAQPLRSVLNEALPDELVVLPESSAEVRRTGLRIDRLHRVDPFSHSG